VLCCCVTFVAEVTLQSSWKHVKAQIQEMKAERSYGSSSSMAALMGGAASCRVCVNSTVHPHSLLVRYCWTAKDAAAGQVGHTTVAAVHAQFVRWCVVQGYMCSTTPRSDDNSSICSSIATKQAPHPPP
jgi:hypothetical protein